MSKTEIPARTDRKVMKLADWLAEAEKQFGKSPRKWKFKCVRCGHVQSGQDFLDAGVSIEDARGYLGFSCIGRYKKGVGCDWTLGGLFTIHTLEIEDEDGNRHPRFEFADQEGGAK